MKTNKFFSIVAIFSGMAFTGCNNAEYGIKNNSVYIAEAAMTQSINVAMETAGTEVNITVRLARHTEHDVTVSLGLDSRLIDQYNEGFGYVPMQTGNSI